jgi:hypothetical protein
MFRGSSNNRSKGRNGNQNPRQRNARRNNSSMGRQSGPLNSPPQFNATFQCMRKVMRFSAPTASLSSAPTVISTLDLFNLLCVQIDTDSVSPLIAALRLRRVSIWVGPSSSNAPASCSLEFTISNTPGNVGVKPTPFASVSISNAVPAFISEMPPRNTACSMWQLRPGEAATGGTAIIFIHSANAIIDITMDLVLQNGETPPTPLPAPISRPVGTVFLNLLDNTTTQVITPLPPQFS